MPKHPIRLEQTETEYLLFIHASERARAKRIEGWAWDPTRRCWVYPYTPRIYSSIIAEFGDELEDHTVTSGASDHGDAAMESGRSEVRQALTEATKGMIGRTAPPKQAEVLVREQVEEMTSRIDRTETELRAADEEAADLRRQLSEARDEISQLKTQLSNQKPGPELGQLLTLLGEKDRQISAKQAEIENRTTEVQKLNAQIRKGEKELERAKEMSQKMTVGDDAEDFLLGLALMSSKADPTFAKIIQRQTIGPQLAIALHNEMTKAVTGMLRNRPESDSSSGILAQARDEGALSEDLLDLAHFIRRQRNVLAHKNLSEGSMTARVLLTLFAAALLWPELVRNGQKV